MFNLSSGLVGEELEFRVPGLNFLRRGHDDGIWITFCGTTSRSITTPPPAEPLLPVPDAISIRGLSRWMATNVWRKWEVQS